ncbi:putative polysaccharide export-related protein [Vibrio sinaloensis DSM 21326]|uniref:Putative polysaccharide export-related protein n=1 Tax=Vibrio sinaloensis DSM 21326 TaxID=945550 RepID=E8MAV5_PHOS4|nr:polysaccharide biosynthesis/export family protein [Vibrio sinaloensis]EGA68785.1 putative polysaccharide export-related protein [Vibrio sinaloensis DSM 21326]
MDKLLLLLSLFVCFSAQSRESVNDAYVLSAGDVINIIVYGEEDLSINKLQIDTREVIEFPYLGNLSTKSKTLNQIREEVIKGLKGRVLINPKVGVTIERYRNIYVNGVVNDPGAFEWRPGLTVEKAVSLAGGFTARYKKTRDIYLTRENDLRGLKGNELEEFLKDQEEVSLTESVGPGDTIYVVSSLF